jgi:hypothetical protein
MKEIKTLVQDIYDLMEKRNTPEGVDVDAEMNDKFGEAMKDLMKKEFLPSNSTQAVSCA